MQLPSTHWHFRLQALDIKPEAALINNAYCNEVTGNAAQRVGQWIWSPTDEKIFLESRKILPDLVPCILVSTITGSQGTISQSLRGNPKLGKSGPPIAIIVRIEDSVHELWNFQQTEKIGHDLDSRLHRLMELLAAADVNVVEVQLDYDCPVSKLSSWAQAVRIISTGTLEGKSVWITSIPAHLNDPNYSALFRQSVKGHILQLFDTGVSCTQDSVNRLSDRLRKQGIPFRIGLGAFERACSGRITDHQLWFSALSSFAAIPGYQGIWIFPGGRKWLDLYHFRNTR